MRNRRGLHEPPTSFLNAMNENTPLGDTILDHVAAVTMDRPPVNALNRALND